MKATATKKQAVARIVFDEGIYRKFLQMTHDSGTTVTAEVNHMVRNAVRENKIPSQNSVII